mgnify:CR=1 FL=1
MDYLQEFNNMLLKEMEIDKEAVSVAIADAAKTIFGEVDVKMARKIVNAAVKKAEDTEEAIQIGINMMRGDEG